MSDEAIKIAADFIKQFEGCELEAYQKKYGDKIDVPTIGYGTTRYSNGLVVRMGDKVTAEDALSELEAHCEAIEREIIGFVRPQLNNNQMAALISLVYNIGAEAFRNSTLLIKLNLAVPDIEGAANEFLKWNHVSLGIVAGLTRRREAERELFLK